VLEISNEINRIHYLNTPLLFIKYQLNILAEQSLVK